MRKYLLYLIIAAFLFSGLYSVFKQPMTASASVYDFSRSIYIDQGEDMYMEGYHYKYGDPNTSYAVIILSFGAPQYGSNGYGIGKYGSGYGQYTPFFGTDSIKNDVEQFMRGYNATHTKDMELAIGFNTSVDCITKYGGNFYDFGRALKVLLSDITPVGHITQISAAIDAEQGYGWMPPSKVRPIIDGFNEQYVPGYYSMYDFGDDELGTNPGSAEKNGWTAEDVWYVANGAVSSSPIAEIYYYDDEGEWYSLSLWAYNNKNYSIFFDGVLSENGINNSYTDSQSYYALLNALQQDSRTYASGFVYNSWMEPRNFHFYNP